MLKRFSDVQYFSCIKTLVSDLKAALFIMPGLSGDWLSSCNTCVAPLEFLWLGQLINKCDELPGESVNIRESVVH